MKPSAEADVAKPSPLKSMSVDLRDALPSDDKKRRQPTRDYVAPADSLFGDMYRSSDDEDDDFDNNDKDFTPPNAMVGGTSPLCSAALGCTVLCFAEVC